jgi:flagellar hook-associated protein 1 FlgK
MQPGSEVSVRSPATVTSPDTASSLDTASSPDIVTGATSSAGATKSAGTAGTAGLAFFTYTAGDEAGTLAVNAAIAADPRLVAAASAANQPGDGTIAGQIGDLRNALLFGSGTQTAADTYASFVSGIGGDSRQGAEMATNQALVVDHLTTRRESISGVSLDEEATDMIKFQHAYQAAARVITAVDEMLDQLINRTGLVGR